MKTPDLQAKLHEKHSVHNPNCYYCITERSIGEKPKLPPYDSPLLRLGLGKRQN